MINNVVPHCAKSFLLYVILFNYDSDPGLSTRSKSVVTERNQF